MVRKIVTLALIAGSFIVAACNTVEGAGKDVKSAGAFDSVARRDDEAARDEREGDDFTNHDVSS